jgi:molybdopterin-guanine dinucleotide biosynthesis protein MobB
VLAVCGFSGAGKTTLLELAIPRLLARGLSVAVVKHDAHGFEVDKPGKDSDRFYRAGATVALGGPRGQFERRGAGAMLSLRSTLARLSRDHDLLLVEGHKDIPLPKFWLASAEQPDVPEGVTNIVCSLPWNSDRLTAFMEYIDVWLPQAWKSRPLYGGLLTGGLSSRMGAPKQSVQFGGRPMGVIAAEALRAGLGSSDGNLGPVALGLGALPKELAALVQMPDPVGFAGPGAGLIAAHRWAPEAAWIVSACDHPWLRAEHIEWLAARRKPGVWAVIPIQGDGHASPLLALYEPQALELLERLAEERTEHDVSPSALLDTPRVLLLEPPAKIADGWKNVNTPQELCTEEARIGLRRQRTGE